VEPDAASPDGITYLSTSAQTLDEQAKKQVIENLGLNETLNGKLESVAVEQVESTSDFPFLLAKQQDLTNDQISQVRDNLEMEDYINSLIDAAIGDAINGGY
jgi:hypothetical protein